MRQLRRCAPDLEHGPEDHDRLGHARQQGLELIEAHFLFGMPYDGSRRWYTRSRSFIRWSLRDGSALAQLGYPDHAAAGALCAQLSRAAALPGARASTVAAGSLSFETPRDRFPAYPRREAGRRRHVPRAVTTPPTRSPSRRSWRAGIASSGIAAAVEHALDTVSGGELADSTSCPGRRRARRVAETTSSRHELRDRHPGPAVLILVHEVGHFFASLAVGMRPRKFYIGFPPALVKMRRRGIEYGIGAIRSVATSASGDAPSGREGRRPRVRARPPRYAEFFQSVRPSA